MNMQLTDGKWLRIAGICGMAAPFIALTCVFLAVASWPAFSWTGNALSDMGIVPGITKLLFNNGLIVGAVFAVVFASGFVPFLKESGLGAASAVFFALDALALGAIGIFPEDVAPMHFYASVAFFVLFPIAGFLITAGLLRNRRKKLAVGTLVAALAAASVWIIHWTVYPFGTGVAMPEIVAALCAGAWAAVIGIMMIKPSSK
ncbi:MAG: DUF998 domain-containing protein [Candidatus Micrarchaeota archaeon]|nr:DUF998 domain-containing protein [Candidatus Micrarchaeota archaeon]